MLMPSNIIAYKISNGFWTQWYQICCCCCYRTFVFYDDGVVFSSSLSWCCCCGCCFFFINFTFVIPVYSWFYMLVFRCLYSMFTVILTNWRSIWSNESERLWKDWKKKKKKRTNSIFIHWKIYEEFSSILAWYHLIPPNQCSFFVLPKENFKFRIMCNF